ncbi:hypothetical protein POM88_011941 [Heracleum sosnowskyi]|uniref:phosphogluconate dehydrogenase (NADP(+)-dependent, decarboxylating) n=1 Tax=Heracleum sosnowskyi TaxID=360622 RepID=A0AAD8IVT5_9APIA|nr:hypothetical protein POM88_011941 [Heracleum sosnowskyi]
MNLIRANSIEMGWGLTLGELARIWKGGCIIRAIFLDRIKQAYDRNADLASLLVDSDDFRVLNIAPIFYFPRSALLELINANNVKRAAAALLLILVVPGLKASKSRGITIGVSAISFLL